MTRQIATLDEIADGYDAVLCDVWGVVHNGVEAFVEAAAALARVRAAGKPVVLLTNSPRPNADVAVQLDTIGVGRDAWDGIVTSGDVTRDLIAEGARRIFHLGPERDLPIFDGLNLRFVSLSEAEYVVCTGLRDDERETPDSYRAELETMRARKLFMLCGNPDLVVERGDKLIYCAGAIADLYRELGGDVLYAGKPHAPIYDLALQRVKAVRGNAPPRGRVLAIGDSVRTDLTGATKAGLDCLFVTAGIHAEELGDRDDPDLAALNRMFDEAGIAPKAVTRRLQW